MVRQAGSRASVKSGQGYRLATSRFPPADMVPILADGTRNHNMEERTIRN
jgi:hypothetical protein